MARSFAPPWLIAIDATYWSPQQMPKRRKISARIALGEQLLAEVAALTSSRRQKLGIAPSVFGRAHAAYVQAAHEARSLRRRLRVAKAEISSRIHDLGDLDAARKDARDRAVEAITREAGPEARTGVRLTRVAIAAVRRAEKLERDDARVWEPLTRLTTDHESARSKRRTLASLWEAAYEQLLRLTRSLTM